MENKMAFVPGSLAERAKNSGLSIAETFLDATAIILFDTSGSMSAKDSRGGRSRFEVGSEELAHLQSSLPGKIAIVSFSSDVQFCPSGIPINFGGGTDMNKALSFVKVVDIEGIRFVLISDGIPDSPNEVLSKAKTFKNKIDTVYTGPEDDIEGGRAFLEKLSKATGGLSVVSGQAKQLQASIQTLLLGS